MKQIEVHSKRSGTTYKLQELNSLQSADAFEMAGNPIKSIHYRIGMAIVEKNGVPVPPVTNDPTMRRLLQGIPECDMDLLKYKYDEAFALKEEDLGNELEPEQIGLNSSTSSEHQNGSINSPKRKLSPVPAP